MEKPLIFFCYFFLIATFLGFSQIELEPPHFDYNNINLPTTPTGASLSKYEDIPVDMATGLPQINIPIFTLNVDGISIPISLSYHASGVQVNELSTAVGLNWTLNAGGGIFRNVNSLPDEDGWTTSFGPLPDSFYEGFPDGIFSHNYRVAMFGDISTGSGGGMAEIRDHNPDDYTYSFLGNSGKFITDFGNEAIKNQADQFEIDFDYFTPEISDQDGNYFSFGYDKEQSFRTYVIGSTTIIEDNYAFSVDSGKKEYGHVTGWMLSKINTKNNKNILFEYEKYSIRDEGKFTVSNTVSVGRTCAESPKDFAQATKTLGFGPDDYFMNSYTVQLLTKISSEHVDVNFYYSEDENLSTWKKKLDSIVIKDKHGMIKKEFHFDYSVFDGDPRLKLERIYEKKGNVELPGYSFIYKEGTLPERYSYAQDFFGYYNGQNDNTSLAPYNVDIEEFFAGPRHDYDTFYELNTGDRSNNVNFLQIGILEEILYPTGGSTKFSYEANEDFQFNTFVYCGGLRVNRIVDKNRSGEVVKTKKYQYKGLEGLSYENHSHFTQTREEGLDERRITTFHSGFVTHNSMTPRGYFYKKVTELKIGEGETHKIQKKFIDNYSYGSLGHLLESESFFRVNDTIKVIEYDYEGFGDIRRFTWNVLGGRECGYELGSGNKLFSTYRKGERMHFTGDGVRLPTRVAITDFLDPHKSPITVIKTMDYDDATLLKVKETVDTRYSRVGVQEYVMTNSTGEKITTNYSYPNIPPENMDFPSGFPRGLLLKKEMFYEGQGSQNIFGQAMEYDLQGNIKTTFQFNKGQESNDSELGYVDNYEEMSSFLFHNGHPIQVLDKHGTPTTYVWNKSGNFLCAKIEGVARSEINEDNIQGVENASYGDLRFALSVLRNDPSVNNKDVMITTYTHKPFAGVETITDPKGEVINYEYDSFGRLIQTLDLHNNLLNELEYKYWTD